MDAVTFDAVTFDAVTFDVAGGVGGSLISIRDSAGAKKIKEPLSERVHVRGHRLGGKKNDPIVQVVDTAHVPWIESF